MTRKEIDTLFEKFTSLRVLVLGDVMLDAYIYGKVERISPEAPVPVLSVSHEEKRPGGAANVALNLRALGAHTTLCSVTGNDDDAIVLKQQMQQYGISTDGIVTSTSRPTTKKTRVIGNNHQMLRVDHEITDDLSAADEQQLLQKIESLLPQTDIIIFEDYNKGVLTAAVIEKTIAMAKEKNILTAVDPKKHNFLAYRGVSLFKPNLKEIKEGLKTDSSLQTPEAVNDAALQLHQNLQHQLSLITLSEKGIFITDHQQPYIHIPAHIRDIADVSGAGDTVIAVAALALAAGCNPSTIAGLANIAGGLVCEHIGVVPVNKKDLMKEAERLIEN